MLLLLFQIPTGLERILGHRLVPNLKVSVNPMSATFARPVTQLLNTVVTVFLIPLEKEVKAPCRTKGDHIYVAFGED